MVFFQRLKKHILGEEIAEIEKVRKESENDKIGRATSETNTLIDEFFEDKDNTIINTNVSDEPYIDLSLDLTSQVLEQRNNSLAFKVKKFLWDGTGKHPKEQRYLMKLDSFLLSSSMLGYFIKNLNQSNIATAYVNGMSEYYGMSNNQYNYVVTFWTVGYIIGQIPSNLILHRISARYYLGGLEIMWSLLTVLTITCDNLQSLYAVRFFLGLFESGYFPGMEYLLGSNYSAAEISSRGAYFAVASNVASLLSGPLQLALLRRFKDSSIPPFKWLFVFDAVISFPIGIYTMFVDPNTPSTTDAFYFDEQDRLVGLERRRLIGAQLNTRERYTWKKVKTFFGTWHIYVFPLLFLAYNNSCSAWGQPTFTIWMKKGLHLTPEQYNVYPTAYTASAIAVTLILAYTHNYVGGKRNHILLFAFFIPVMIGCIILAVYDIPKWLHYLSFWLVGIPPSFGQPFIFSWVNRLFFDDDMKRNFLVVSTNILAYVTGAWVSIFTWNTNDQPRYFTGFVYTACLCGFGLIMTTLACRLSERDEARKLKGIIANLS